MSKFRRPINSDAEPPHQDVECVVHAFVKAGHKISHTDAKWAWQQVSLNVYDLPWATPMCGPGAIFELCKEHLEVAR